MKFSRPGQSRVSPLSDVDVGIYQLQRSENLLGERIKALGLEADKYGTYTLYIKIHIIHSNTNTQYTCIHILHANHTHSHYTYMHIVQIHLIHADTLHTYRYTLYIQILMTLTNTYTHTTLIHYTNKYIHTRRSFGQMGLSV